MGFFRSIPRDLEEAAMVDGATRLGAFWRVILPLTTPGILAAALFAFTLAWNEFLYALVFLHDTELKTIPVGLNDLMFGDIFLWGDRPAAAIRPRLPQTPPAPERCRPPRDAQPSCARQRRR